MTLEGKILVDPHCHLTFMPSTEAFFRKASKGIYGYAWTWANPWVAKFEDIVEMPRQKYGGIKVIDRRFAEIRYKDDIGGIINVQEVRTPVFHFLSIGCTSYAPAIVDDPFEAVDLIEKSNGIPTLNHPYLLGHRIDESNAMLRDGLYQRVAAVEVHNAQLVAWLSEGNLLAKKRADELGVVGIAGSDAHSFIWQMGASGFYVNSGSFCMESLEHDIRTKNFTVKEGYVSLPDFAAGIVAIRLNGRFGGLFDRFSLKP